jgi:hypothetical protein
VLLGLCLLFAPLELGVTVVVRGVSTLGTVAWFLDDLLLVSPVTLGDVAVATSVSGTLGTLLLVVGDGGVCGVTI